MKNSKAWILKNCRFARIVTATVTLSVADYQRPKIAENVNDLAWDLQGELYKVMEKIMTPEQIEIWRKTRPSELVSLDGDSEMHALEGILNFYTAGLPRPIIDKMVQAAQYHAPTFGGTIGQPKYETYGENPSKLQWMKQQDANADPNAIRVVRLPATIDQNAVVSADFAPEINYTQSNMRFIFMDILNYPSTMFDPNGFTVDVNDLLMKLGYARTMLQQRVDAENQERQLMETKPGQKGPTVIPGYLDVEGVEQRLDEIERLADWAKSRNYMTLVCG